MPLQNYNGDCFVAFTDISGFKVMMKNGDQAALAIDRFYTHGFHAIRDNRRPEEDTPHVNGFFISDCGILFTPYPCDQPIAQLQHLLNVVKDINRKLLSDDVMLTTSIAWGNFSYHNRIEFPGIQKNPIYGNAYLAAFLDNETGNPGIQPGQCRIIDKNLPDCVRNHLSETALVRRIKGHHYFYWMVNHCTNIDQFNHDYSDSYKLKYAGMMSALKIASRE